MKTVIEMAREAGMVWASGLNGSGYHINHPEDLERFAEFVRADEREKYKWDIHSCGPTCKRYACVAMREAVEAENEACAKVAGWLWQQFQDTKDAHERNSMEPFMPGQFGFDQSTVQQSKRMMDAIRARRNT